MSSPRKHWFKVREELSSFRRGVVVVSSFLLPSLLWIFFSYFPGLWKVSYKLVVTTDLKTEDFPTIYRLGYVMEEERFRQFQESVRSVNAQISAHYENDEALPTEVTASKRGNKRVLRKLYPLALQREYVSESDSANDAAIYELWRRVRDKSLSFPSSELSRENREIIRYNSTRLFEASGPSYQKERFPSEPLLHLIPTGEKTIGRPSYLPAPHEVIGAGWRLVNNDGEAFWSRYFDSLGIVLSGFLIACIVGLPLGLFAGTFDFFSKLFEPFIDFFRYLPAPAFGTLLVFLLGSHDAPKVALVFLGTVCQTVLMSANTTRQLDKNLLDAAQTLGAKQKSLVFRVVIPGVIHQLYNDLRILLGWSWTWLVIAELMGVKSGLTEIIDTQGRRFNFDIVYATIITIGITGFLMDQVLLKLSPRLFPWTSERGGKAPRKWFSRSLSFCKTGL